MQARGSGYSCNPNPVEALHMSLALGSTIKDHYGVVLPAPALTTLYSVPGMPDLTPTSAASLTAPQQVPTPSSLYLFFYSVQMIVNCKQVHVPCCPCVALISPLQNFAPPTKLSVAHLKTAVAL